MTYFARFYLGFDVDEWTRMSWWKRRLYTEGLATHMPWNAVPVVEIDGQKHPDAVVATPFPVTPERPADDIAGADLAALEFEGFTVQRV